MHDQHYWFNPKDKFMNDFFWKCEGSTSSVTSSVKLKLEMERAALKVKAAALEEKLALEREEAELVAEQNRQKAVIKAKRERNAMRAALAESDAKAGILQKYDDVQPNNSGCKDDTSGGQIKMETMFQPTLQYVPLPSTEGQRMQLPMPQQTSPYRM